MDTQYSNDDRLVVNLLISCMNHGITFGKYRVLAEWLGVYQYILPADRYVMEDTALALVTKLMHKFPAQSVPFILFLSYEFSKIVEINLTQKQQQLLLEVLYHG